MGLLKIRAGETSQQLRVLTALAEGWRSGSGVHDGWLPPACNFSFREFEAVF